MSHGNKGNQHAAKPEAEKRSAFPTIKVSGCHPELRSRIAVAAKVEGMPVARWMLKAAEEKLENAKAHSSTERK